MITANPIDLELQNVGTPEASITWFANAMSVTPLIDTTVQYFIECCREGKYQDLVHNIRQAATAGLSSKVGLLKRKLPAATISCTMTSRAKNSPIRARTHSGWLQCDFDGKENMGLVQSDVRKALMMDPHVGAVFVGPSGVGIKCLVRIDGARHLPSFHAAKSYFYEEHGLVIDQACKDVERLCFVSYDPDAYCRQSPSQILPIPDEELQPKKPQASNRQASSDYVADGEDFTATDVREILGFLPRRPDYDTWLRIASGVFSVLPMESAIDVLNEWAPEERPGEYAQKYKNRLKSVTIRTVIHFAQQHGFDAKAAARRKTWLGRLSFGPDGGRVKHGDLLEKDVIVDDPILNAEEDRDPDGDEISDIYNLFLQQQAGDSALFLKRCAMDFAYDHLGQCWRKFDVETGLWTKDMLETTNLEAMWTISNEYQKVVEFIKQDLMNSKNKMAIDRGKEDISLINKRCDNLKKANYLNQVMSFATKYPQLNRPATDYDQQRHILGLSNGHCIDFQQNIVRPTARTDRLSVCSPAAYDPEATSPNFDAFLHRAFGGDLEMVAYWWRIVGYSLTGYVDHDALFFCYGLGANGKSTGLMALRYLLGDQLSTMVDVNTLLGNNGSDATLDYKKSMLEGKRLIITDELPDNKKINESMVKGLLGGEDIVARRPYERPYTFSPTHKIWMVGNHKPKISGVDHGIWRRIHLIPWEVTIPLNERKNRSEIWRLFKSELSGMLNHAINGYLDFAERKGLCPPDAVVSATEEYRLEEDSLRQYVAERLIAEPGAAIPLRDIFSDYRSWCDSNGETAVVDTNNKLTRTLKQPPYSMQIARQTDNVSCLLDHRWAV
jgi:P4 family phage/plasmid primase-like protien